MVTTLPIDEDLALVLVRRAEQAAIPPAALANQLLREGLGLVESRGAEPVPFKQRTFSMGQPRSLSPKMLQLFEQLEDQATVAKLGQAS